MNGKLENRIGYNFKNKELLSEALTHSSFNGDGAAKRRHNERLEFLGDSVLSVIVSEHLFNGLKALPEGQLTKIRASLVCEASLFSFANKIKLGDALLLGKGEEQTGGRLRKSILADAFEALIAAIFLDCGLERAREFLIPFLPDLETLKSGKLLINDYKTVLQEIIQQNPEEKVSYRMEEERGEAHQKIFTASVLLNGQVIGKGDGASKKEAEQMAAKEAISLMGIKI